MKMNKNRASDKGERGGNEMNSVIKVRCYMALLVQYTYLVCVCVHVSVYFNLAVFVLLRRFLNDIQVVEISH